MASYPGIWINPPPPVQWGGNLKSEILDPVDPRPIAPLYYKFAVGDAGSTPGAIWMLLYTLRVGEWHLCPNDCLWIPKTRTRVWRLALLFFGTAG